MKKQIQQLHSTQKHKGFVLLFTLVVSTIIFFIGAGMYSIAFKELITSSIAQESQKSIYAADAGVECGLYIVDVFESQQNFTCFGETVTKEGNRVEIPFDDRSCVWVTIEISGEVSDGIPGLRTIYGQGFNKCDGTEPVSYPGLTERVYKVTL